MEKPIELREADFKREIWKFSYLEEMKQEFFDYWTEPFRSGNRMRYEGEKTWHLGRRLARWAKNGKDIDKKVIHKTNGKMPEPTTNEERLDAFIDQLRKPGGTDIPFKEYGRWYEWMKENKLLKSMYQHEIDELKTVYKNDNEKCRCAVVQKTLMGYINNGLRVQDLLKMRAAL